MSESGGCAAPWVRRGRRGASGPRPLARAGQLGARPGRGRRAAPRARARPASPGGLGAGLGTGSERPLLGPRGRSALARAAAARLGRSGQRQSPGRGREGAGALRWGTLGPCTSPGRGAGPSPRRHGVKFSAPLRRGSGGRPLYLCAPERQVASVALRRLRDGSGPGRRGREVGGGRGSRGLRDATLTSAACASGRPAASGRRRVPASLSGPGPRRPLYRAISAGSPRPLLTLPLHLGPRETFRRQLLEVGPAGRRERLCPGVMGEGFGRVSVKNNLWRPPVLAVCTSSLRGSSRRVNEIHQQDSPETSKEG